MKELGYCKVTKDQYAVSQLSPKVVEEFWLVLGM